jgi:ribonuclease R
MKGTRRREPNDGTRVFKTGSSERKPRSSKSGSTSTSKGKSSGKSRRGEASGSSKSVSKKSRNKKFFENAPKAKRKKKR